MGAPRFPAIPGPAAGSARAKDMEKQLAFMTDLSAEVKKASDAGKCFDPAGKEVRLPQYGTLTGYEANIEMGCPPLVRLLEPRHLMAMARVGKPAL